ncbi:MAG: hypothetical protein QME83_12455 [Thermodesulfobacteriota bacterium]|nr:hypothetical protein [Thermodesulfobacteriota bacterium]
MKKMQVVKGKYVIPAYDRSPIENGYRTVELEPYYIFNSRK